MNSLRFLLKAVTVVALASFSAFGKVDPGAHSSAASHPHSSQTMTSYISGGKKISVQIYEPQKQGKYPVILVIHGSNGPMSSFVGGYGQQLADQGFVVAFVHYFDRTGNGAYPSYREMEEHFPEWVHTIRDGITFVEQDPKADGKNIGLLGVSLGGFVSTSVSSIDPRVKAVVNFCGGIPATVAKDAKRLAPTLILHGDADQIVPVSQAYALEDVLKRTNTPFEIEIYPGEGHMLRGVAFDAMARALSFLDEHLHAPALAQ